MRNLMRANAFSGFGALVAASAVLALVGCRGGGGSVLPSTGAYSPNANAHALSERSSASGGSQTLLFVANCGAQCGGIGATDVTMYHLGAGKQRPPIVIPTNVTGPGFFPITVDSAGDLFAVNAGGNTVEEYQPGHAFRYSAPPTIISADLNSPVALALDPAGNLFVANFGFCGPSGSVTEYPHGNYTTASPTVISTGVSCPVALGFDSSGDLFVVNLGGNDVTEYPAVDYTTASPTVITADMNNPVAVGFDSSNDLFVSNCGNVGCTGSVVEYPAGDYTTASPAVITSDVNGAFAQVFDSSGNLFVAMEGNPYNGAGSEITEFPAGNYATGTPAVISNSVDGPYALILDCAANVFVANFFSGTVTEYPAGNYTNASPTIISKDVQYPYGLALHRYHPGHGDDVNDRGEGRESSCDG